MFSQSEKLNDYENKRENLKEEIAILNDSLNEIELEINRIKAENILKNIKQKPILGIAKIDAKLKDKPDLNGEIIIQLKEETPIQIIDLIGGYFQVCINENCGYMSEIWVKRNDDLRTFIKVIEEKENYQKIKEKEKRVQEAKIESQRKKIASKELDEKMLKKYGQKTFGQMKQGYYWVGMNREMLEYSLGEPDDINKSVGSWGTNEQWVYGNGLYIYLENDKVTSYQN